MNDNIAKELFYKGRRHSHREIHNLEHFSKVAGLSLKDSYFLGKFFMALSRTTFDRVFELKHLMKEITYKEPVR